MKRFVLPLLVVTGLVGTGVIIHERMKPHARAVASWLPATTILFEDMPDAHRTEQRWPGTDLAQIINEPEVQVFIAGPLGEIPYSDEIAKRMAQVGRIDPEHFFLAVTEWTGNGAPKSIAGLRYAGKKDEVDALMAELRKAAQERWPDGKSDIEQYGAGEIETFTTPEFSAGVAYRGDWVFLATDTGLLKATLDRYEGRTGAEDSLERLPAFKTCLEHLPAAPDNVLFLRPALMADKLESIEMMANPTGDPQGGDSMRKADAIGMGTKLDGELMRDAMYVMEQSPGDAEALKRDAFKLTTPGTLVAVDERTEALKDVQLPDPNTDPTGVLRLVTADVKIFEDKGLGGKELDEAFGPEMGFVLDLPAGTPMPAPLALVDVKDAAMARKFLDTLTTVQLAAGVEFTRQDVDGISYYSLPQEGMGFVPLQVTLGLTGNCLIGGLSVDAVKDGAHRWEKGAMGLAGTDAYRTAGALVGEPTMSFTYVDTKAIFERVYEVVKPFATMGVVPHLSDYVDVAKLPQTETIGKHLSPIVSSASVKDGGLLVESAGPVTLTQLGAAAGVGAGAAAIPMIIQQYKGQSVAMPGFPPTATGSGQGVRVFSFHPPPVTVLSPRGLPSASASPSAGSP